MKGDWISHDAHRLALGCMGLGGSWNDKSYDQNHIKQAHSAIETALEPVSYTHLTLPTIYSV